MIQMALTYLQTIILFFSLHTGMATHFSKIDESNPNPHLACIRNTNLSDNMYAVAHRTLPCGTKLMICAKDLSKCTNAIVADRLGNHCKKRENKKCVEYWSDIDLTPATGRAIKHNGFEPVLYMIIEEEEWKRKENLELLKKRKKYVRLSS